MIPVSLANPFAFPAEPPLVCYPAQDRLAVLARDRIRAVVRQIWVDDLGRCSPGPNLPLAYVHGATPRIVSGSNEDGEPLVLNGMDRVPVPVADPLAMHPVPFGGGVVWADAAGLRTLDAGAITIVAGTPVELAVGGDTIAVGFTDRTELLRGTTRRSLPRRSTMALAMVDDRYLLAYLSTPDSTPLRDWYGPDLAPMDEPTPILPIEQAQSLRIYSVGRRIAVGWHTATGEWVAAIDPDTGLAAPPHALADPGCRYGAGAWIGDRLVAFHGAAAPLISVFTC